MFQRIRIQLARFASAATLAYRQNPGCRPFLQNVDAIAL